MNDKKYLAQRSHIVTGILRDTDTAKDDTLNRTFNFVSANLLNFLPEIAADTHEYLFKDMLLHQQLSLLEYRYPEIVAHVTPEGSYEEVITLLKNQPCIVCTFHMGSNRVLNHLLAASEVPYAVVMANHIAQEEGEAFKGLFADAYQQQHGEPFTVIEAQKPDACLKMLRELKKGKSLIVYIDGNTGAGDDSIKNENRCRIDFLNGHVYARSGVAYLSHLANVPVVTAVSYRKSLDTIQLRFGAPIYPDLQKDRKTYAAETTQKIYNTFMPLLKQYPEQWECWMYLHKVVDYSSFAITDSAPQPSQPAAGSFHLNKSRFGFFNIGEEKYLFNKRTYTSYRVSQDIYSVLLKSFSKAVLRDELSNQVFEQLYANRVFVQA